MGSKRIIAKVHAKRKVYAKSEGKGFVHRDTATGPFLRPDIVMHDSGGLTTGFAKRGIKSGEFPGLGYGRARGPRFIKATGTDGSPFVARYFKAAGGLARSKRRLPAGAGDVIVRASQLLGSEEAALEWLKKPSRWLEHRSPLEMIQAGEREAVDRYLGQIEYGVYV